MLKVRRPASDAVRIVHILHGTNAKDAAVRRCRFMILPALLPLLAGFIVVTIAAERAELLAMLGVAEGERVAPTLRAQVRRLEEQQKRRARRIQTDTLIRAVADIQTVLRDALTLQLGAQAPLLNEYLREPLQEYAARTSPAQTLSDVQAVETTLRRLRTNANARLALEALMSRFVR